MNHGISATISRLGLIRGHKEHLFPWYVYRAWAAIGRWRAMRLARPGLPRVRGLAVAIIPSIDGRHRARQRCARRAIEWEGETAMKALKPISRRLGRIGLALAVLVSLTAVAA